MDLDSLKIDSFEPCRVCLNDRVGGRAQEKILHEPEGPVCCESKKNKSVNRTTHLSDIQKHISMV